MGELTGKMPHHVRMEERSHAVITGVHDVCSFHDNEIVLKVETGVMIITGEGLHVGRLLLDEGHLDVAGQIDGIQYEHPHSAKRFLRIGKRG